MYVNNMGPWNANKYPCFPDTDGVFQVCTVPNNNVQSCLYLIQLKCDAMHTYVMPEVALPTLIAIFIESFAPCWKNTIQLLLNRPHTGCLAARFWMLLMQNFLEEH